MPRLGHATEAGRRSGESYPGSSMVRSHERHITLHTTGQLLPDESTAGGTMTRCAPPRAGRATTGATRTADGSGASRTPTTCGTATWWPSRRRCTRWTTGTTTWAARTRSPSPTMPTRSGPSMSPFDRSCLWSVIELQLPSAAVRSISARGCRTKPLWGVMHTVAGSTSQRCSCWIPGIGCPREQCCRRWAPMSVPVRTVPVQVIVAERGPLVWVFNFSPFNDYEGFKARLSLRAARRRNDNPSHQLRHVGACLHGSHACGG